MKLRVYSLTVTKLIESEILGVGQAFPWTSKDSKDSFLAFLIGHSRLFRYRCRRPLQRGALGRWALKSLWSLARILTFTRKSRARTRPTQLCLASKLPNRLEAN